MTAEPELEEQADEGVKATETGKLVTDFFISLLNYTGIPAGIVAGH